MFYMFALPLCTAPFALPHDIMFMLFICLHSPFAQPTYDIMSRS